VAIRIKTLYSDLNKSVTALENDASSILKSRAIVEKALENDEALYGINTGFGILANKRIDKSQLKQLQKNLILSHSVGVGDLVPKAISRLMMQLKIHALGLGYSGISKETFDRLIFLLKQDLIPVIPEKGSLGASGDLAPLAHMALPLIGEGHFWNEAGDDILPADEILKKHNIEPIHLQPKDGLALINGTQLMSAYGSFVLEKSVTLLKTADLISAMSIEALRGSKKPFDKRVHKVRPHQGAQLTSQNIRRLLSDSEIMQSHKNCGKVQDPYSLRCIPAVHGAARDALVHCTNTVETEINSVTDNPLVFNNGDIISAGNFHGEPLAMALDYAKIALAEFASIAERRTYLLLEGHDGLPKLLMEDAGINSGFMIPQYTSAALVSENKVLCHPSSVDSIPSSLGQEDYVSMGSISALKLLQVYNNVEQVLAIELLTAAQALDFRKPLKAGRGVETAHDFIRQYISHSNVDHLLKEDIDQALELVQNGDMIEKVEHELDSALM